ncbi:uncharacterized protein F5Z01DRAFT_474232 [Emericellopsis atlantica]|uniref:Uncharacterized protein n=1 Tax=Emericellopsis atlantica TaxID=2614577 RepID=A0A9P7ZCW0_9HYPO|nr:uncharacterized protein F5Z01DRAFT_474232 [Emericellopsis atlantica]KAG9249581.1 hypothetical protein F5Z01DRAFT_474232 [Emericellopsis atlantica]
MIPFDTQYTIVTELQSLLEQTCFAHAKRTMPFVLSRRRWDFACSANLASWADLFRKTKNRLLPDVPDTKFECLAESMVGILNAAVNRTPMPWSRMSNYFQHAELLAISLGESEYAQAIQALFIEVSEVVSLLAGNEIDVRRTVRKELAELAVTRERILQKEVDVKESFLVEMERLQKRSKAPIMEAVRKAAELRLSQQSAD